MNCILKSLAKVGFGLNGVCSTDILNSKILRVLPTCYIRSYNVHREPRSVLLQMHMYGAHKKKKRLHVNPLQGAPQLKGVVLRTLIKKPKKPNSANRKCVYVRLSNGREAVAYVPGEGHSLQEHSIVLVEGGKLQDVPGVRLCCCRGKYDLPHVKKKSQ